MLSAHQVNNAETLPSGTLDRTNSITQGFIIHLSRAQKRRENAEMLSSLLPFSAQILPAIDGRLLLKRQRQEFYQRHLHQPAYPFELSDAEIGCFLSHRKAWQAIVDSGIDAGLVMEDDIVPTDKFYKGLSLAQHQMGPNDFIRFPMRRNREAGQLIVEEGLLALIEPICPGLGMGAQLVSRGAAKKLLQASEKVDRPVDVFLQMFWLTGVAPKSVTPQIINEVSRTLGGSTLQKPRSFLSRCTHEFKRPLYRRKIMQLARLARKTQSNNSQAANS